MAAHDGIAIQKVNIVSEIGSPSLDELHAAHWNTEVNLTTDRLSDPIIGLAEDWSSRLSPKAIVVTTKRVLVYKTFHNPTYGLRSPSTTLRAEVDIAVDTITQITKSDKHLTVTTKDGSEYKLRLIRATDANFVAQKIGGQADVAWTYPVLKNALPAKMPKEPSAASALFDKAFRIYCLGALCAVAVLLIWSPWSPSDDDRPNASDKPTQMILYPSVHCSTPAGRAEAADRLYMSDYLDWWQEECTDPRDAAALIDQLPREFCDVGRFARIEHLVTRVAGYDYLTWSTAHCE